MLQLRESAVTPILLPFWTRCGPSGPHGISPACHDHGGFRTSLKTEIELTGFNHGRFSATSGSLSKGPIAGGVLSSISAANCKLQCSKHDFSLTKNNQRPEKVVDFSAGARRMPVRRKKNFFFPVLGWIHSMRSASLFAPPCAWASSHAPPIKFSQECWSNGRVSSVFSSCT